MAPISSSPDALGDSKLPWPPFIPALYIVKSKPPGALSREYIHKLASYIRDGSRPTLDKTADRHVDFVAYWRDKFYASEEEQAKLRTRIAELESTAFLSKGAGTASAPAPESSPRKRKRVSDQCSSNKTQTQPDLAIEATPVTDDKRFAYLINRVVRAERVRPCDGILYQIFMLRRILAVARPNPKDLAASMSVLLSKTFQLIASFPASETSTRASIQQDDEVLGHDCSTPDQVGAEQLEVLGFVFPCILEAMELLLRPSDSGDRAVLGSIIHGIIKIFQDLLNRICQLYSIPVQALSQATRVSSTQAGVTAGFTVSQRSTSDTPCQLCRARHKRCDGALPKCRNCRKSKQKCVRDTPVLFATSSTKPALAALPSNNVLRLCSLAMGILDHLNNQNDKHVEVLDGILFLLLQKVGKGLRSFSIDSVEDENQGIEEAQAPCLIWILERALNQATKHTQLVAQAWNKSNDQRSRPSLSTLSFSANERIKFENTLLKAVFGDQVSYEHMLVSPSAQCLEAMVEDLGVELDQKDLSVQDWFKQEVWRLIGWNRLKEDVQW